MINIIGNKRIPFIVSSVLFVISMILVITIGLRPGIDFTGGSLIEISFSEERPSIQEIKGSLESLNLDLGNAVVQPTEEKNVIIRLRFINEDEHQMILKQLRQTFEMQNIQFDVAVGDGSEVGVVQVDPETEEEIMQKIENQEGKNIVLEERIETIGPAISSQLRSRAVYAVIAVVIAIIIYVAYAFRKVSKPVQSWKYGLAAIIALIHDISIVLGIFVLLGKFLNVEIGIPFVVALLTVLGYSVNDSIVVFDRVRENLIKRTSERFPEMVNMGINQTFIRSINTSVTTLVVLFALFLFGGESIKYFALALIIGVASGTYSSIFLASPLLVFWEELKKRKQD